MEPTQVLPGGDGGGSGASTASDAAPLQPGTDVGGYVIETKIGEGGMGIVYGAQQPRIGKRVAIKVLGPQYCKDPAMVQRFEQEARLVNEIHHGNIVDIFQLGELPDGRKYLVMEWLEGESLSDRIERGPMRWQDVVDILDAMCDALIAVHEKGIVHRDLKSDNVFLVNARGQTRVKLLDFGLAKLSGNDPRAITKTKTGIVVGTPHYMAPEQIRGKPVDSRMDIYALGVLAFKMLTARLPFTGSPTDLLVHHLKTPAPSPATVVEGIPDAVCDIVMRMMAKLPEERPTLVDIRAVFADLKAGRTLKVTAPTTAATAAATAPAEAASKLRTLHVVLIVIGVLAAAAISFIAVREDRGDRPAALTSP